MHPRKNSEQNADVLPGSFQRSIKSFFHGLKVSKVCMWMLEFVFKTKHRNHDMKWEVFSTSSVKNVYVRLPL